MTGLMSGRGGLTFLVAEVIMVELNALIKLEDVHLAQGLNYLEAYRLETGLLINFGARSLEYKRITNVHTLARQINN